MPKEINKIPQTALGRAGRLLWSGARMMSAELVGRLSSGESKVATRVKQAQELVQTLGQLKGAAMKAGQLVSLEFADILPPEVVAVLRQLHDDTQFMPIEQVRYILAREIGVDKRSDILEISSEPIAAASIGQVHRATLDGKLVAIKIQYPGIARSIDSDLKALRRLAELALQIQGNVVDLDPIFEELSSCLKQEADYRREAEHLEQFASALDANRFVVPRVFRDYSSERVITMSFEEGIKISQWLASQPSLDERQNFAEKIVDLVIQEVLTLGKVQSDPNFGNFLYRPKDGRIVLLDFGATICLSEQLRGDISRFVRAAAAGEFEQIVSYAEDAGLFDRRESGEARSLLGAIVGIYGLLLDDSSQPFRFRNPLMQAELRQLTFDFVQEVKHTPPPRDYIFLGRKIGGMLNLLRDIDATVNVPERIAGRKPNAALGVV